MRHKRFIGVLVGLILALALSAIIGMGVGAVMRTTYAPRNCCGH